MIIKSFTKILFTLCFIVGASWVAKANCPVDLGPDIDSCEGESIVLDADTGDPGDLYQWFRNGSPLPGAMNSTLVVNQSDTYSVEVNDGTQTCQDDIVVMFNALPVIFMPAPIVLCDDEIPDEITIFDLTVRVSEITGNNSLLSVSWFETEINAQTNSNQIVTPTAYFNVSNPQTVFVRVEDATTGCVDFTSLDLMVQPRPSPTNPSPLETCDSDNDGFALFSLTDKDQEIINGEPNVVVTYHENLTDATAGVNALVSPYSNVIESFQTVYARVVSLTIGCFTIVDLDLIVFNSPIIVQHITPIFIDEGDGDEMAIFDLTVRENEILLDLDPAGNFDLSYFESLVDAQSNTNPIATPTSYANTSNPQTIYVGVQDVDNSCYGITDFIIITDGPGVPDDDGDGVPDIIEDINRNGNLNDDDTDGDTIPNYQDTDDDGDTVDTIDEISGIGAGGVPDTYVYIDTDGNFIENYLDTDDDGDGTFTEDEDYNNNGTPLDDDVNGNSIPDFLDPEVLGTSSSVFIDLQMFPNPARDEVFITSSLFSSEVSIEVFTVTGVKVLTESFDEGNQVLHFSISNIDNGLYFIQIFSAGNSVTKKLIKK